MDHLEIDAPLSSDLLYGSAVHHALEAMFEGEDALQTFKIYWEGVREEPVFYQRFSWDYLMECGVKHIEKFRKSVFKHIEVLEMEKRRFSKIGSNSFEGTADVYGYYKGVPSIIDFKTSAYNYHKEKIKIADQLYGYAHLYKDDKPEVEQIVYVVMVKTTQSIQTPIVKKVTKKDLEEVVKNTGDWIKKIKSDKVFPRNPNSCIMGTRVCEYFEECYGKERKH